MACGLISTPYKHCFTISCRAIFRQESSRPSRCQAENNRSPRYRQADSKKAPDPIAGSQIRRSIISCEFADATHYRLWQAKKIFDISMSSVLVAPGPEAIIWVLVTTMWLLIGLIQVARRCKVHAKTRAASSSGFDAPRASLRPAADHIMLV